MVGVARKNGRKSRRGPQPAGGEEEQKRVAASGELQSVGGAPMRSAGGAPEERRWSRFAKWNWKRWNGRMRESGGTKIEELCYAAAFSFEMSIT